MPPPPILVHGGKEIGVLQKALGGELRFVGGLGMTDETALAAVPCSTIDSGSRT